MSSNHLLSEHLEKTWKSYEQAVHGSRDKLSAKHVHELRVSTQRLEAVLSLAQSLKDIKHADHITELLKKIRKSLGPLRDSQVESPVLKNLRGTQKMKDFFKQDKRHAQKKAKKALENIHLKHERIVIDEISHELLDIESGQNKKDIQSQLDQKMKSSVLKFNLLLSKVKPEEMKNIHQFRIFAKKLRYQAECLQGLERKLKFSLKKLKNVQSVAGKVQNDTVLISKLNQFLSESKRNKNPQIEKICKQIDLHRENMIKKDFSKLKSLEWAQ